MVVTIVCRDTIVLCNGALIFQNARTNLNFTCPRQSGKCLCSTLYMVVFFTVIP